MVLALISAAGEGYLAGKGAGWALYWARVRATRTK